GGRFSRAVEDRGSPPRHRLRRHHDAAPGRLSDMLVDQAQQDVQVDTRHHAVEQGRALRSRARPYGGFRAVPDEAVHEGRVARCDRASRAIGRWSVNMTRVLIVDDSPTEVHYLRSALERNGFETEGAATGQEGLQKAKQTNPGLILLDVVMPGLNGFQATRELGRDPVTARIPVIMVTTKSQETDRIWGLRKGAGGYVVKPVSEQDLVDKARAALAR